MGMSNASLGYLNYPTQVIFKCCKLIPVMFGGIFIQGNICWNHICINIYVAIALRVWEEHILNRSFDILGKKYGILDFLSCLLMSVGLTLFILADSSVHPKFNYIGMSLLVIVI